jgi:hypothetical protein
VRLMMRFICVNAHGWPIVLGWCTSCKLHCQRPASITATSCKYHCQLSASITASVLQASLRLCVPGEQKVGVRAV